MKNSKYLKAGIIGIFAVGLFLLGYYTTVYYYPNLVYRGAVKKMNLEENTPSFRDLPDATFRSVVKPNPDFLYVIGTYNLSKGAVQIKGIMPDSSYWSLALYAPNTVNYYVKNDQEYGTPDLNIVIKKKKQEGDFPKEAEIVTSKTKKGLFLFRILVTDNSKERVARFKKYQESVRVVQL